MLLLGRNWTQDIQAGRAHVCATYDPVHQALPSDGVVCTPDLAYGTDPRQVLDIYKSSGSSPAGGLPVVVFVHGGAFIRGNKDSTPYIYANVPKLFAREGYLGINVEYRLAPEFPYPCGAEDVSLAVSWVRQHARSWGGDPDRIVLFGHSAGGSHVASYLTDPLFNGQAQGVVGAILVSARLDADTLPDNPNAGGVAAYYGTDVALQQRHAPMAHAGSMAVPLMVAVAEYENPYLELYGLEYAARVAATGCMPRIIQVMHHNHTSIVAHIGCSSSGFTADLLEFVATHTRPSGTVSPVPAA